MAEPRRSEFRVPPEVPRYFADRDLKPAFSWLDVWGEEHAHAFTVAKAVDVELLGVFRDSIKRAIDAGQGFETWRAGLLPELQRIGWGAPRLVADPTGARPDRKVDFTAPGRLQTIFSANLRSSRAAGQWERIQRTKDALPYLLYVRTTSKEPRAQHLAWAGIILPADDPWWRTHFPPNGWRCKCAVRQISRFERGRLLDAKKGPDGVWYVDEAPPLDERTFVNRRTGEISRVPDGIDPGWGHNPGLAAERRRAGAEALTGRVDAAATPSLPAPGQPPVPPVSRSRLQEEVRAFVQSDDFARQHAAVKARRIARRDAGMEVRRNGGSAADEAAAREAAAPAEAVRLPVAVMPERLDAFRGAGPVAVTVDEAAIGASSPVAPGQWTAVQDVLERGEIQAEAGEPDKLWGFLSRGRGRWSVPFARIRGAWQALGLTLERANRPKPEGRAVLFPEADPEP